MCLFFLQGMIVYFEVYQGKTADSFFVQYELFRDRKIFTSKKGDLFNFWDTSADPCQKQF